MNSEPVSCDGITEVPQGSIQSGGYFTNILIIFPIYVQVSIIIYWVSFFKWNFFLLSKFAVKRA